MSHQQNISLLRLVVLLYLSVGLANPIEPRQDNVTAVAFAPLAYLGNNNPKVPWLDIVASAGAFWIFKRTTSTCPLADQSLCPPGYRIEMLAYAGSGGLSLVHYHYHAHSQV